MLIFWSNTHKLSVSTAPFCSACIIMGVMTWLRVRMVGGMVWCMLCNVGRVCTTIIPSHYYSLLFYTHYYSSHYYSTHYYSYRLLFLPLLFLLFLPTIIPPFISPHVTYRNHTWSCYGTRTDVLVHMTFMRHIHIVIALVIGDVTVV